jgi:hypothetical protein
MRLTALIALLLTVTLTACSSSPTATLQQPGSARAESTPPTAPPSDTTNAANRGLNGFGSGN